MMPYSKDRFINYSQKQINELFVIACRNNDLGGVTFLLTSTEIPFNAQINKPSPDGSFGICVASGSGHTEMVKFLATSNKLKELADIHIDNDNAIVSAIFSGNEELMKFFIIDMNARKSIKIIEGMESFDLDNYAKNLFEIRELNKDLKSNLVAHNNLSKKVKL